MITRKDYIEIASILRHHKPTFGERWNVLVIDFERYLARTNPQFNSDKFLQACGIVTGKHS